MYPRSFLYEEAKIKQRTALKKELCEIGEEAIWESRFTSFFRIFHMVDFFQVCITSESTQNFLLNFTFALNYLCKSYLSNSY